MIVRKKKVKKDYVDNAKLLQELIVYKERINFAKSNNQIVPRVPDVIARDIWLIAKNFSTRPNFIGYRVC